MFPAPAGPRHRRGEEGCQRQTTRLLTCSVGKYLLNINNRNLPGLRKPSTERSPPRAPGLPPARAVRSCGRGKKAARASTPSHVYSSDFTGESPGGAAGPPLWKVCTSDAVPAASVPPAQEASSRGAGRAMRGGWARGAGCGSRGVLPGMHVRRRRRGSVTGMSTARTPPHTDSSVESSSGLMYSNPSNSDWSILFMTSSSSGVSCTGSLVNCVSKLSRP